MCSRRWLPLQITSFVVDQIEQHLVCLFGFVSHGWGHPCPVCAVWQCVFVHLFVRACMCVCVREHCPSISPIRNHHILCCGCGQWLGFHQHCLLPHPPLLTSHVKHQHSHTVTLVFSPWKLRRAGRHGYAFNRIPCWPRIWNLAQPVTVINCMNKFPFWKSSLLS